MYRIPDEQVRSVRFVRDLNPYTIGSVVMGDEWRTWPETNRRAMVDQGFVELVGFEQPAEGARALDKGELVRVVVPREDGRFDVVEGRKINIESLNEYAADALANEKALDYVMTTEQREPTVVIPGENSLRKRKGGRPKGAKNKNKVKAVKRTQPHKPGSLRRERNPEVAPAG